MPDKRTPLTARALWRIIVLASPVIGLIGAFLGLSAVLDGGSSAPLYVDPLVLSAVWAAIVFLLARLNGLSTRTLIRMTIASTMSTLACAVVVVAGSASSLGMSS